MSDLHCLQRAQPLLGTMVSIHLWLHEGQSLHADRLFNAAFTAVRRVHGLMSVHDPDSALSRLNHAPLNENYRIDPWLYQVLLRAMRVFRLSDGVFDCAIAGAQLSQLGKIPQFLSHSVQMAHSTPGSLNDLLLLGENTVLLRQRLYVDLGGIAKGYAVDRAIHVLRQLGVTQMTVNAGGDLRVYGPQAERIQVRDPEAIDQLITLGELEQGACATSGIYYSLAPIDPGHSHSHSHSDLVNPLERTTSQAPLSYTVIARTAVIADALTKVVAITQDPTAKAIQMLGAQAIIVGSSRSVM